MYLGMYSVIKLYPYTNNALYHGICLLCTEYQCRLLHLHGSRRTKLPVWILTSHGSQSSPDFCTSGIPSRCGEVVSPVFGCSDIGSSRQTRKQLTALAPRVPALQEVSSQHLATYIQGRSPPGNAAVSSTSRFSRGQDWPIKIPRSDGLDPFHRRCSSWMASPTPPCPIWPPPSLEKTPSSRL